MYCRISLNRLTFVATGLHIMGYVLSSLSLSVSEVVEENAIPRVN
jgi:hypothetical protein